MKIVLTTAEYLNIQLVNVKLRRWIDITLMLINISGIGLLLYVMSGSKAQTSSTMPVLLDVMINFVEVIILLLSRELREEVDYIENMFQKQPEKQREQEINSDEENVDANLNVISEQPNETEETVN